jgi:hypothetical protein
MEINKMTRIMKILAAVGMSSVYLMQVPCTSSGGVLNSLGGNGLSILPNVPDIGNLIPGWPF